MKKPTFFKNGIIALLLLWGLQFFAQNYTPFTPRFDRDLRGDIVLIGNNILGPNNNAFNDDSVYNHNVDMRYIDIDSDGSTYSSSSAVLSVPNPNCYRIIHASLYWGAVTRGDESITNVKLKGPSGNYNDVTGTIIYDAQGTATGDSFPYSCYADVTDIVTGLGTQLGTYTMANVSSAEGRTADFDPWNGTGYSAGWSLFIVYEDPTMPGKSITSFDGFSAISSSVNLDIPVSGFRTVPSPTPVRANFAFATLEGDKPIRNDRMLLNGVALSAADRDANNFFNSSITQLSATPVNDRNPNSTNTLGFDTGVMVVPNPSNTVIGNNTTSATVRLESDQDVYFQYFFALAVDIIEPKIFLTKIVEDESGNDIGGELVGLGTQLNYVIGFENRGNDDATETMIRDILPINIIFNYPEDIVELPPGVTVRSYDTSTREIIFDVDNALVEQYDPVQYIRFKVKVVESCSDLEDACSNIITNQAFATYKGTLNPNFVITDDPSFSTNTGCLLSPSATNFLADLDCTFVQEVVLCGDSTQLTAADGYSSYSWSTNPNGNPVIGTGQSITVTNTGTYYSFNTAEAPCQSIEQEYLVQVFGGNTDNPVIPYADEVVTCPNDGKLLPNIFLCGDNDSRFIQTNITDSSSMIWDKLNESSCDAVENEDCANEDGSCTWNQIETGPNFLVEEAGQYRLTINYEGGCFNQFYFNVYENLLVPTVTAKDINCTTPGEIIVGGIPNGYEYSIDGSNYQSSNVFTITNADIYTVYIRQVGVESNPCVFTVPDIQIRDRNFEGSVNITQPYCFGDKGSVILAAIDALPQYYYSIYSGGTLINEVGPISQSDYTFANLNTGDYTVNISTEDGCTFTDNITIVQPPLLTATSALTTPLTCKDGDITVYPEGGTPPYFYFVNSSTEFQDSPIIVVSNPGDYNITVVDSNNCSATTAITVESNDGPTYTIEKSDITCSDVGGYGSITINVSNGNGNNLQYSINNGLTYFDSNVFTDLTAGDYIVLVQSVRGNNTCTSSPQTITIIDDDAIVGTVELTTYYTCDSPGTITVSEVNGGVQPYSYSIDGVNFQASGAFSGLLDGSYTVTVRDSNDCTFMASPISIDALNPPTDLDIEGTTIDCQNNTASVTVTNVTNGVAPFEYQISAPASASTAYQASNIFENLAQGTYTFQVRDANNCIYSENYNIEGVATISVTGQKINDISCLSADDGAAKFTVTGTDDFQYSINNGASATGTSPINLTGLADGTYSVLITENSTGCTATTSVVIASPDEALTATVETTPNTCSSSGSAIINAAGGWGSYSYELTQPDGSTIGAQNSKTFTNLSQSGTYTIMITDSRACVFSTDFNLTSTDTPSILIDASSNLCYDGSNDTTIVATTSEGTAPYQYSLNGGAFQSGNTFGNLIPGAYTIEVRDANGCTSTSATQTIATQLTLGTVLNKDLDCTSSPEATITGTFSGGTAPYTYAVSVNGGSFTDLGVTQSPFTYSTSSPANYQFEITDALGCTIISNTSEVNPITSPEIIAVVEANAILCHGESNAEITITVDETVGVAPFTISVFNNSNSIDYGTQTSGLPAGDYTITITDANSCTDEESISINEPTQIAIDSSAVDISCSDTGISSGSVIVESVSGGTAPYNYYVTGTNGYNASELNATGSTSTTFDVVDFGLYQIDVVDANGCSMLVQDILVASPPSDLDINISSTVDCASGGVAEVSIGTATVGSGPFYFSIYQGPTSVYPDPIGSWIPEDTDGSKSATFTDLIPGVTYTFIVYDDGTGCSYYETASTPIPTNSTLTTEALVAQNISCKGSSDGSVSFTINSVYTSTVDVNYEIFDSLSIESTGISGTASIPASGSLDVTDLGPLPYGNYFVLIEETSGPNAGCGVISIPFNITESTIELDLTADVVKNANCNPSSGVITAIATDGTAPYQYLISTSATPPSEADPNWAGNNTFNVDGGTYSIYAKDSFGCIKSVSLDLPTEPTPIIIANASNECTAVEGSYEITVELTTTGVSPYSFSVDGGAFQNKTSPFVISGLASGTHTVEVRDANGCNSIKTLEIAPQLDILTTVSALPSCTNDDGEITINTVGGSGSYTYAIAPNSSTISISGNVISGVPAGSYTITVTDTDTSCSLETVVDISEATPVSFTALIQDVSCNGDSDGVITIQLPTSNDNPTYTYEILSPISVGPQNSNIFSGLLAGTYSVRVNSGRGCSYTLDATIGETALLTATPTAPEFTCNLDNSFDSLVLTITEDGGTAPFSYSIDGVNYFDGNTFEITDNGSTQNIDVYVQDANGCIAMNSITIESLPIIESASVAQATPIDCNNTGSLTIIVNGGSGNYSYQQLPDGTAQSSNTFTVTEPGDYYFQVNDLNTECFYTTAAFTVAPYENMAIVASAQDQIVCYGEAAGSIEFNVSNYTGSYEYEIVNGSGNSILGVQSGSTSSNPVLVNNVPAGSYTVSISQTGSPFCTSISNSVTIVSPSSALVLDVTETSNVSCTDDQGTITAVANGGWGNFEYELSGAASVNFSVENTFRDLQAGSYTVTVRDEEGCTTSQSINLSIPAPINADVAANASSLSCFGDTNGSIIITNITGGQGSNYSYTLHSLSPVDTYSGPQNATEFSGLGAGTYQIIITDGLSCEFTSPIITIDQPELLVANLAKSSSATCTTDSELTLSATGGTAPYSYSEDATFSTTLGSFNSSVTFPIGVGTYTYFIKDANGCIAKESNEVQIDALPDLEILIDATNAIINCAGEETGVIVAEAQGGLGNYVYTLQDSSGNDLPDSVQDRPGVFTSLAVGNYQVYVESGDCLQTSGPIAIEEPSSPLMVEFEINEITCSGENDGFIEITATGGNGIIKYAISPQLDQFFDDPIFENLWPGEYEVIVQDELGCYVIFDFTISEPTPVIISITPNSIVPEVCAGDLNGEFSIDISGGNLPYSVSLDDYEGEYLTGTDTQTQFDFADLGGGDHTVFVRDSLGCESEWNITFPDSVVMNPEVNVVYECTNNSLDNTVTVSLDEGITDPSDIDYSLDGGAFQASNTFNNVPAGLGHYIDVRHTNGCIQTTLTFDIDEFVPVELAINDGEVNEIVAVATGGKGEYEFFLNGESYGSTSSFFITESGEYTVMVVDANGCLATVTRYFEYVDICIPNYFTPNGDGIQDEWAPGCSANFTNLTFDIFDRYGRKVAEYQQGEKWDGKYNGTELPTGDYWFVVKLNTDNDGRQFVGHFTLYR